MLKGHDGRRGYIQYRDSTGLKIHGALRSDPQEIAKLRRSLSHEDAQALADMAVEFPASQPLRFVEVPCLPWDIEQEWRSEAFRDCDARHARGEFWIVFNGFKEETVPKLVVEWLKRIGRERGIRYKFDITHIGY